jgi:hypothetical protein
MKLRKKEKTAVNWLLLPFYLSGVLLLVFSRWIRVESGIGELHHPTEQWVRVTHSVLSYAALLLLGYLVKAHVLPGLKARKRLRSGVSMLAVFGILGGTALGILYSGEGTLNTVMIQVHDWLGVATVALFLFHSAKIRSVRSKARQAHPRGQPAIHLVR